MDTLEVENEENSILLKFISLFGIGSSSVIERTVLIIDILTNGAGSILIGVLNVVAGILDVSIRVPITIVLWILHGIQFILEATQYVVLDLILYGISESVIFIVSSVTFVINLVLITPFRVLYLLIAYAFTIGINYVRVIDFVVFRIAFPVGDVLDWYAAFVFAIVEILCVTKECMKLTSDQIKALWQQHGYNGMVSMPILYAAFYIWRIVLSLVLFYVIHPVLYVMILVCVSCGIVIVVQSVYTSVHRPVLNWYAQTIRVINEMLDHTRTRVRRTWFWLQHNWNNWQLIRRRYFEVRAQQNLTNEVHQQTNLMDAEIANKCVICFEQSLS